MLNTEAMLAMQRRLQERYEGWWEPVDPSHGLNKLMWMTAEIGEAAQVIKRKGHEGIMSQPDVRADFVEEMCDVMMYFHDVLLCYGVTPEELENVYRAKHERNMTRWKIPDSVHKARTPDGK